jgi:membrane-bound lytic murein transglycosylase A
VRYSAAACLTAAALSLLAFVVQSARGSRIQHKGVSQQQDVALRHLPYPELELPLEINNSQYAPLAWTDVSGWNEDDHLAAYRAFRTSCRPIAAQQGPPAEPKALGTSLRDPCGVAKALDFSDRARAKAFFEEHFLPLRISKLGDSEGFVTGYYEPIIQGSRTQNEVYNVPVYRRPSNLFVRGVKPGAVGLPNKGEVFRKIGRRKLAPYYDRAEIEDGAIEGRGLELCWLKDQTDLLFTQIQGSARVLLDDGSTLRINYDAHNGYPYTPVGRILIERGIIPRELMSMQRIREWMERYPNEANELRRQNRSYVFFREVQLSDKDEAVGAQGVPLTPGRSIAVDKSLHVYGTPFFIAGELPIESELSKTPFHRLMIAQDTGSAITGPARADLYFGAGPEAGKVSGRLKHSMRFVMLIPRSLDPVARGRKMPVPDPRPSEKIAKLFPQVDPAIAQSGDRKNTAPPLPAASDPKAIATPPEAGKEPGKNGSTAPPPSTVGQASSAATGAKAAIPLPEPRPNIEPSPEPQHPPHVRHHHRPR